ncbi:MAG: sulfurtransferase [Acidimicrobiales bacterium]|nr:sulfurtransferase [Acidimicrobiales bacterium]
MVAQLPPFVSVQWLQDNAREVVICDVRMRPDAEQARAEFEAGHIPGARFVDLNSDLAAPPGDRVGRHPLHDPVIFAATMGLLGIGLDTPVVAYDDSAGAFAARMVWMLRATGTPAAVLDGGRDAWSGELVSGEVNVEPVDRPVVPWPDHLIADRDDVIAALEVGTPVIDSRAAERYRGEVEPLDRIAGHIPGAVSLPFTEHLSGGTFDAAGAGSRFADVGVGDGDAVIYCGSGVTACVNVLAAEAAGLGTKRLYVGSWSGWSTTPDAEIATGD